MRYTVGLVLFSIFCSCLSARPPVSGGFMTGADSSIYIFWFHPDLHAYEQGIDGEFDELNLAPGDVDDEYTIVQRAEFPFMSYVTTHLVKIYPGDMFPDLLGNQFSPFGHSIYYNGLDSLPKQPAVLRGRNSLCGGIPCNDQWVENSLGLFNINGADVWFGLEWADTTQSAPQVRCIVMPDADRFNKLGVKIGEEYTWNSTFYCPVFRYHFLALFPINTSPSTGWRKKSDRIDPPDSFLIMCYETAGKRLLSEYTVSSDTLCLSFPNSEGDSVSIIAWYRNIEDDSALSLRFNRDMVAPISVIIDFGNRVSMPQSFDLIINNNSPDIQKLVLGYDDSLLRAEARSVNITGHSTTVIPFYLNFAESDSLDLLIFVQDVSQKYYPILAKSSYPPQTETAVDEAGHNILTNEDGLVVFPNPCRQRVAFSSPTLARPAIIEVYNIIGQKVAGWTLRPGHGIMWDGRDKNGNRLSAGIYMVRMIETGGIVYSRKIVLL